MIFRIDDTVCDTCGNEEADGETEYLEADNTEHAWRKLGRRRVVRYWIGRKEVDSHRTPAGKGHGIWEPNPRFDWKRDMGRATAFQFCLGGLGTMYVRPIKVRK